MTGYVELDAARWDLEVATGQAVAGSGVEARMREARAAAGRLAAGLPGLLDELEQLRRLPAELADARAEVERLIGASGCNHLAKVEWFHRAVAAERALEAVRAQVDEWRGTHWANDVHERSAGFADDIRAVLSAASPTTSDNEPARCLHGNAAAQTYACGCEPARCPHGHTEGHRYSRDGVYITSWCPGPAASGTPEATR